MPVLFTYRVRSAGKFNRRQTGKSNWDEAKAVLAVWEETGSWDGRKFPAPPPPTDGPAPRVTVADAIAVFISIRESGEIAPATLRKYRTFTKQLGAFAESRGYVMLGQFGAADLDKFYGGLKLGARAKGKRLGTIRSFFRSCIKR